MAPRARAWIGSVLFLLVVPGTVAGFAPWLVSGRRAVDLDLLGWSGAILVAAGTGFLVHAFIRFVIQGLGTPSPVQPTEHLVVTGAYRWVRNPMYLAVLAIIMGQAALRHSGAVIAYAALVAAAVVTFVKTYEEPTLATTYPDDYAAYRRAVRGWLPRRPR